MTELQEVLEARKEEHGTDDDPDDMWGVDELDELEEESEEEEEAEEEEEEEEQEEEERKADKFLKDNVKAEDEKVAQRQDKDVDALAEALGKTAL